jgi:hypothetical protein
MKFQDRSSEYEAVRGPDELDLLSEVTLILNNSTLHETAKSMYLYAKEHDILNKKDNVQRFYLNKFFNLLLMAIPENTIDQRYCLITDGTVQDWLYLFKKKIVPYLRERLNA